MSDKGYVLITGASSGIGASMAREYAKRGRPLILTARRKERLEELAAELSKKVDVHVIAADLSQANAPAELQAAIQSKGLFVETLVNNAGLGISGRYLASDWKTHADFIQLMITAVAELTHRFLPEMEKRGRGEILNVASLAGFVPPSAGHTLYGATKAWMIRFSECLAMESEPKGIRVTALCPGMTYTEFHDVNGMREKVSNLPKFIWLSSDEVVRQGINALERGKRVIITGKMNNVIAFISQYLPRFISNALVNSQAKNFRDND
jgi:uncharacterized protein